MQNLPGKTAFVTGGASGIGLGIAKVLAGGAENEMQTILKRNFRKVANVKPPASRQDSSEKFVVAMGFRGKPSDDPRGHLHDDDED